MKLSKKIISIALTAVLVLGLCLGLVSVNPVSHAAGNCIVKVKLDSLGKVTSVNIKVNSTYSLPTGSYLDPGSYTVYLNDGKVALKNSSGSIIYTSDSGYIRLTKRDPKDSGIKIGSYEYLGDFVFAKNGSYINVINHVDMETYLIGVVPYEIGENFNIEALKAQAVSARSYSYDRLNGSTSATSYDIGDTSKDQVYRGYNSANKNCIKAVMETAGQVLTYNGNVISTLYSASNGGMTSSNYYRWGTSPLPYFKVKLDEFDKTASFNSSSYNTKFYIPKVGSSTALSSYVQKTLMPELLIQLYEKGYSTHPKNFEILGFDNLSLHTARFNDEYCIMYLYLKADVSLNAYKGTQGISPVPPAEATEYMQITGTGYSGRCSLYEGPSSQYGVLASPREGSYVQILSKSGDYYEILAANGDTGYINKKYLANSRFTQQTDILMTEDAANQPQETVSPSQTVEPSAGASVTASAQASGSASPQTSLSPSPQAELIPAPQETITLTLNIPMEGLKYTATCEDGYTFSFMNNKLVPYVQEQNDCWLLTLNGNGHGIGLSQIGARARAQAGHSYAEILAFYFDDTKLKTLDYEVLGPNSVPELDPAKWYGVVSLKDPSSSLNVRSAASTNSSKLGQLRNGTYIELLEKLSSGWYKIMFNGSIGYVSSEYITEGEKPSPTAPNVSAAPTAPTGPEIWTGTVSLIDPSSSLYVRATPDSNGDVVASVSHGTEVELVSENNGWFYISYTDSHDNLIKGYVNASYIIAGEKPAGGTDQTPPAPSSSSGPSSTPSDSRSELYIGTVTGTADLPIRAQADESSDILASVKSGASLTVLDDSGEIWCYVRTAGNIKGYCSKNYLVINKLSAFNPPQGSSVIGTVKDMDLNVRSQPSSSSVLLATISLGTKVNVIAQASNDWYYIRLADGSYGYVSYRYLDVETVQNTPTVPPTASNTAAPSSSPTLPATTAPPTQTSVSATPSAKPSVSATPSARPSVSAASPTQTPTPAATPSSSGTTPSPSPETGKVKLKNASSRLNVRSGPGTSYAITGRINNGASVTILAQSGGWYQIQSGSVKGYVSKDYIVLDGTAPVQRQGIVTGADSLRVRKGPGTSYVQIASIKRNTAVAILYEVPGWYKVRLANGTEGYCSAEYITVSSTPGPVEPSDSEKIGTVTGIDILNVRSGPSVSNGLLFTISRGTQVKVLETTSNGWHKIQVMNKIGYVSGTYLEVKTVSVKPTPTASQAAPSSSAPAATTAPVTQPPSSGAASTATAPPTQNTGKIKLENSTSRLNVRSGPGTSYSILGKLNYGASVTILSQTGEWYQIQSGSLKGYVLSKYVVIGQDVLPEPQGIVTGTDSLHVLLEPIIPSAIRDVISRGTKVFILNEIPGWYKIRLANGVTGYCSSEYITVLEEGDSDKPEELGTGIVSNISSLNVRSGPSTNYGIVSSISGGTKVTLISRHSNGWYYISTPSGIKGYVSGNYIKVDSDTPTDTPTDTPSQTRQGTVTLNSSSSRLNIRSSAGTSSNIIGKIPNGAKVTILSQSGSWYKIQYNGITGFASKSYIVI